MTITKLIENELSLRTDEVIDKNPSYCQTESALLDMIDKYSNSRYQQSEYDSSGNKKPFYNVSDNPRWLAAKEIDVDWSDVNITAEEGHKHYYAWLFEKELKSWAEENDLSQLFNRIISELPQMGHIVLKKVRDDILFVNLNNIYSDPKARWLSTSNYIIEKHEDSYSDFLDNAKEGGWDMTTANNILDIAKQKKKRKVVYYERYGDLDDSDSDSDDNYVIIGDPDLGVTDEDGVLYTGSIDPEYKEMKWEDVKGRHLGRGMVEKMFEPQIAQNTVMYYLMKGLQWTAIHLFQTKDQNIAKNLLTEMDDGDILRSMSGVEQIDMEERNIPAYNFIDQLWQRNIQSTAFSYESLSGQRPPSGTTLGSHVLSLQQAGKFYGLKREDISIFLRKLIQEWIISNFKKDKGKSHMVHLRKLLGDDKDSENLFNAVLSHRMIQKQRELLKRGENVSEGRLGIIKGIIAEKLKDEELEVPAEMYENVKMKIDVIITTEKIDAASRNSLFMTLIQMVNSNPQALQNPMNRRLINKIIELNGLNPAEVLPEEVPGITEAVQETKGRQGGSIARPSMPNNIPSPARQEVGAGIT